MTKIEIIQLVNILCIWGLAVSLMWIRGKMKYSIWECLIKKYVYHKTECFDWLMERQYYIWFTIATPLLLLLSVFLLSQLDLGLVRIRTEITLYTSIGVWFCICPGVLTLFMWGYRNEIKNDNK